MDVNVNGVPPEPSGQSKEAGMPDSDSEIIIRQLERSLACLDGFVDFGDQQAKQLLAMWTAGIS